MINLQIRLLAEQAGMLFDERDRPLWVALDQVDKGVFLIEYAELIVKECIGVVKDSEGYSQYFPHVTKNIEKHFKVKP